MKAYLADGLRYLRVDISIYQVGHRLKLFVQEVYFAHESLQSIPGLA